jgi:acyl carrier protein
VFQSSALVNSEELIDLIRATAPEILGEATADSTFEQMEVDSLSLVEIAVMISEKYRLVIHDWEIAEAGSFPVLAGIVSRRRVLEEAS